MNDKYFSAILAAKAAYLKNENVTNCLKSFLEVSHNTDDIIEIAYDLQTGSYVKFYEENKLIIENYTDEAACLMGKYIETNDTLLDIGAGELTTLTLLCNKIEKNFNKIFALDISLSRLSLGQKFWDNNIDDLGIDMQPICAEIGQIPMANDSVDIITSSHALEPNGHNLDNLLAEILRVARKRCILFEPRYETASPQVKVRMDSLGYIKGLEEKIVNLGGKVIDIIVIKNPISPLNPNSCYVIEPPMRTSNYERREEYTIPGSSLPLTKHDQYLCNSDVGLIFPIINGIPILRTKYAVLASIL